jgi:hypothetical protein
VRNALDVLVSPHNSDDFYTEQDRLDKDKKVWSRGKVVNKIARYNLCFDEVGQEPDYENKKGRIIPFSDVPLLSMVRTKIGEILGDKGRDLMVEGNYYYDISKCYIGYHGDAERRKVIGIRAGSTFPLYFQWYHRFNPIGDRVDIDLNHGDLYMMTEKAVGTDWKKSSIPTLRHAAGDEKHLK